MKGRIVVVETVFHQPPDAGPSSTLSRFSRWLESDERPYVRGLRLGPAWQPVEQGWLDRGGSMLVVANDETEAGRVIEVGLWTGTEALPFARLPPGEAVRLPVVDVGLLRLRASGAAVRCTQTLFPL